MSGRAAEVAWIDAHVERTGDVEEVRSRPWATVLRVPTAAGPVWMKLPGPQTRFEVPLYGLLARRVLRHRGEDAMRRARDAYLEAFADLGARGALAETLVAACRVAKIARTLTWVRAAPGEDAAAQQLATLLEESHV